MSPVVIFFFSQGDEENVLTLWKMDPHQARMGFAQGVDNSLIPGKLLLHVQHILHEVLYQYHIEHALLQELIGFVFWTLYGAYKGEKEPYWNSLTSRILNLDYLCDKCDYNFNS